MNSERKFIGSRAGAVFLAGTILSGWSVSALAQDPTCGSAGTDAV